MRTCTKCGSVNNPDSKFCFSCGNPLAESQSVQPDQVNPPVQPVQPLQQDFQAQQPSQPYQSYQPIQPQQPQQNYQPQPMQPPYQQFGNTPVQAYAPYADPAKNKKHPWVLLGSVIVGIISVIGLILSLTNLGSSVLGFFGIGKGAQFETYYNDMHLPLYKVELELITDLNNTLLQNANPNIDLIYQKTQTWKTKFDEVLTGYVTAGRSINEELLVINDLSVSRVTRMTEAIGLLIQAIEQDDFTIYEYQFMPKIDEYNAAFNKWSIAVDEIAAKYNRVIE